MCKVSDTLIARGFFVGAVTGAFGSKASESGLLHRAGIGAISGAVLSIQIFDASLARWYSGSSLFQNLLLTADSMKSLFDGRLVREHELLSAIQWQIDVAESGGYEEVHDMFEVWGTKGMPSHRIEQLPTLELTSLNISDASDHQICCTICLQDHQVGETARRLPNCGHMFHMGCIDEWLIRHSSCPLCRLDL
ncbi:hypothetical protein AMTR_s00001p00161410 [Amborella trichopoda]|uniref:RING-type domain-containing protein n=1 Tax=Amborella trichopoda TaxID=13333 RepID=W1NM17_AMBTC|nr:hypothetical protein AMTR_s00001p00161410 [Amborella trichopoda]